MRSDIENDMRLVQLMLAELSGISRGFWFLVDKNLLDIALYAVAGLAWIFTLSVAWYEAFFVDTSIFDALIASAFTMAGFAIAAAAIVQQNKIHIRRFVISAIVFLTSALMSFGNIVAYEYVQMEKMAASPLSPIIPAAASVFILVGELGSTIFFWGVVYLVCSLLRWYHHTPES